MRLAFITSDALKETSGGFSGVNYNTYKQLSLYFDVSFTKHINLKHDFFPLFISRIRRKLLGLPGDFDFFSPKRLRENASAIGERLSPRTDAIFFHGTTPWVKYTPILPYFAYVDVCFHTFFFNTFSPRDFKQSDLNRIWREESLWMKKATTVFFKSEWGLRKAMEAYNLEVENLIYVGRGGNVLIPQKDAYDGKTLRMISIARNFRQKGGDIIFEAYLKLKKIYSKLEWNIIGGEPDRPWQQVQGIRYHGILDKNNSNELKKLLSLLGQAFVLVHPTREDTNPLVISEAGYFGCPSISVKRFAIPELIKNGDNGILLDYPADAEALVRAVRSLIEDPDKYKSMRRKAREYALRTASWDAVGERIAQHIKKALE